MVKLIGADQLVQQGHQQSAIGAGFDRNPFVGNRRVARAYRVDGNEAPTAAFELGQCHLERVAVVVFGRAQHDKELGALQVGPAKLPEAATHGVDHASGHIDRTKAAMSRVVGCAELTCKQAGQGLHLVAPGE